MYHEAKLWSLKNKNKPPPTTKKQLSGSTSNQLLTAKGKYNLFFTLLRKIRFIYLRQSH